MSRPPLLPTAPDHERHDPLLMAQFAAGDALDPEQQRLANRLATTCEPCGALVDDLRAVSAAVAWEPLPPRRRDYRISPEQAMQQRGGWVSRLMRRLALPRAGHLRPAAAGVMSLGLLFVVAGAAWPFDSTPHDAVVPAPVPRQEDAAAPATAAAAFFDDAAEGAVAPKSEPVTDTDTAAGDTSQKAARVREIEPQALAQDSSEMAADGATQQDLALEAVAGDVEPSAGTDSSAALDLARPASSGVAESETGATSAADVIDIQTVLVALGLVLAAGGALVLMLVWLARRSADPFLR